MKRIKILYLIDKLDTGGTQRHLVDLVTSIDRTVFEPRVVCLMSLGALAEELTSAGIAVRSLNLRRIYGFRAAFEAVRLARVVRDECIPLIHSYLFSANLFGMLVSRLSGTYLIISKRDLGFEDTRARKFAARLPARFADIVTANSNAVAGHLRKDEGIPREKIRMIYNGVKILSEHKNKPVMIKQDNLLITTFHPELTNDTRIHKYFLNMAQEYKQIRDMQRDIEESH